MKNSKTALLLTALFMMTSTFAKAAESGADFDSLGSNEGVLKRARSMNTKQEVRIVQKRAVDRDMRLEVGAGYGGVAGGNSYLQTQPFIGALDFHFTPRFSIGARYMHFANKLTAEGEAQVQAYQQARANGPVMGQTVPDIDFPTSSALAMASYYPMYGKLNFFDLSVVQFDIYLTGGYGQIELRSGPTQTWTAGGGVGFWWTKHISSRFEIRHQAYQDQVISGRRDVGMLVGTFGLGILL